MRSTEELISGLEFVKREVSKMAWALSLHVRDDGKVEREADNINGWLDDAIDRIRTDAAELK